MMLSPYAGTDTRQSNKSSSARSAAPPSAAKQQHADAVRRFHHYTKVNSSKMNPQTPPSSLKRGKKACTECRQQKAKCDAYLNPDQPCTRCMKMKTRCVISDPFRREHKRRRLSELQHETDELRRKLRTPQNTHPHSSPIDMLTAAAEMGVHSGNNEGHLHLAPPSNAPSISPYPQQLLSPAYLGPSLPRIEIRPEDRLSDPTISRSLKNVEVTADEIDEMFQSFFHHCAPFLPILDPRTTPNSYYSQSPFLFWAIIGVACRKYTKNPTLMTALSRSIIEMAFLSIVSVTTPSPWHTIQGLLLLLTWPFSKDKTKPDIMFPLSGMLLHIAMQNGLHIPLSSHEFSRTKIPAPSEADMIRRSELWAYVVIVYQTSCAIKGQSARTLANLQQELGQKQVLFQKIAPPLVLKVRCHDLIARCSEAVLENGVRAMSLDQERALDIIIRSFESQITELESQFSSADDRFQIMLCRLNIQTFHFFKTHTITPSSCLPSVLATACKAVDSIQILSQKLDSLANAPVHVHFGVWTASVTLLRILKGPASWDLDLERAKSSFFASINLAKQMSIERSDTAAKLVNFLNHLWNSNKAFRKSDGSEYLALRIRSRLVLSPILDAVWWWREDFDRTQGETSDGIESNRDNPGATISSLLGPMDRQEPLYFDDEFLADFEWALGEDGMFPPTEPYGSTWSSTGIIV